MLDDLGDALHQVSKRKTDYDSGQDNDIFEHPHHALIERSQADAEPDHSVTSPKPVLKASGKETVRTSVPSFTSLPDEHHCSHYNEDCCPELEDVIARRCRMVLRNPVRNHSHDHEGSCQT